MRKYIRLLSYDNACKLIKFINTNDSRDYANITVGGVAILVSDENWDVVETYLNSLTENYEISGGVPSKVNKNIKIVSKYFTEQLFGQNIDVSDNKFRALLELLNQKDAELENTICGGEYISIDRTKKYARHQHFIGTQGNKLVEFDDWKSE